MTNRVCRVRGGPVYSQLEGPDEAIALVARSLTFENPRAQFIRRHRFTGWDGNVRFFARPGNRFLSGLTSRIVVLLQGAGYTVDVPRPPVPAQPEHGQWTSFEFRPYQLSAVEQALQQLRIGLQSPTSSGKTEIGLEVVRRLGLRTLWIVHRRTLMLQTVERAEASIAGLKIGVIGDGVFTTGPLTIGIVQSLTAIPSDDPFWRQWQMLVIDEAHHAGADSFMAVGARCVLAHVRVGLSGTLATKDIIRDLKIEGVTGPTMTVTDYDTLVAEGFMARPVIRILRPDPMTFPSYPDVRESVLPDWRRDPRRLSTMGTKLYEYAYQQGIVTNRVRNLLFLRSTWRHAVAGDKVLLVCNRVPHSEVFAQALTRSSKGGIPVWRIDGQSTNLARDTAMTGFTKTQSGAVLVVTPFFREGIDLPAIDVALMAGGGEAEIPVLQALGRALRVRPDKSEVLIYDALDGRDADDPKDYLARHARSRLEIYAAKNFLVTMT